MSYLYFIAAGDIRADDTPVKIGITRTHPLERLGSLQVGNHERLEVACWLEVDERRAKKAERVLHKICTPHRIRGEWFRSTPFLRALLFDFEQDIEGTWKSLLAENRQAGMRLGATEFPV